MTITSLFSQAISQSPRDDPEYIASSALEGGGIHQIKWTLPLYVRFDTFDNSSIANSKSSRN